MIYATPENMKKYWRDSYTSYMNDEAITITPQNPVAYSFETGEEYSANPSDYWDRPSDVALRDNAGNAMVLVFETKRYVDVEEAFEGWGYQVSA